MKEGKLMNKTGIIGEILETGGSLAKKSGKTIAKAAGDTAKAATAQVTGGDTSVSDKDIVKNLYGIKDDKKTNSQQSFAQNPQQQAHPQDPIKSIEDKQKLAEARRQLHNEVYYDPLINLKKPQEEERPAEKVEKEKQEEMIDLQKKEKDKPPPLVQRTQQRVEKYPGASG